jgi:ribosomal protein S18 acetylase RimI-like enzyme
VATIRPANLKQLGEESERLREVYNAAWEKNWGFVPFTAKEFRYMAKELRHVVDPDLILVAEVEGRPVGFILAIPDINAALRHLRDGRLTRFGLPMGLAKLLFYKNRLKTCRLTALGVVPEFRRHGIAEMLVLHIIETGMFKKGLNGECSLVLENNTMMNRFLEAIGAEKYKTYRIYSRRLDEQK